MTRSVLVLSLLTLPAPSMAQPKKSPAGAGPGVIVAVPLGVPSGAATKVTLRGLKLDTATEVRFPDSKATAKLLRKGKAGVPNLQKPEQVGDTEAQLEVTLPAELADGSVPLVVVTPSGASEPHRLLVG